MIQVNDMKVDKNSRLHMRPCDIFLVSVFGSRFRCLLDCLSFLWIFYRLLSLTAGKGRKRPNL